MEQYTVTGMSCAACSARVEKAVKEVSGVQTCSVSLLTNSMGVEGTASTEDIIKAVEKAGYGAAVKGMEKSSPSQDDALADRDTPVLKRRLILSLGFLVVLMYLSMGHMMWDWPLPERLEHNPVAIGILQMLLALSVMIINQKFFVNGWKGLVHRAPNMDTLVALGSAASFLYSLYALLMMSDAQAFGHTEKAMEYMHEFYFESAAMILTLITVGKMLEARSKGKTTDALKSLMKLSPKTAILVREGNEIEVNITQVQKDDIFVVRPGENVPVDGIVIEGHSAINEAALTGESIPVDKEVGDKVSAATLNQSGYLKCKATRVGEDTTLSQIIKMVSDAAATKAPIAKVADKVSGVFVPIVITIAVITTFVWLLVGESVGFAIARGISVLVISCPCALGLATPVAIMVGNGVGARHGIMFKTAAALEQTGKSMIVALDKTGTITKGEPTVTDVIPVGGIREKDFLELACAVEKKSEHPLARAIMEYGDKHGIVSGEVIDFQALPGHGLRGKMQGKFLFAGNQKYISQYVTLETKVIQQAVSLAEEGKTPLFFGRETETGYALLGIIAVADVMKEDSKQAIHELQDMGIHVVMLTGDNERTANAVGKLAGVDRVVAGVLPGEKEAVIRKLQSYGMVAMVGDGINDAPALTRGDIGIAIGAGTDIAIDAADVVLMKSCLSDVSAAIRLSRATKKNIHENLFWAFIYNAIGIPLAAGAWIPIFGWELNPMFGAAAMSLSSFCVVSNALRLNLCKIHDAKKDKVSSKKIMIDDIIIEKEEDDKMEKTMKIEGMMCGHCEAAVKKCLEALPEVAEAVVSHEAGTAVVKLSADIADEVLKKTVEDKDYTVISIA